MSRYTDDIDPISHQDTITKQASKGLTAGITRVSSNMNPQTEMSNLIAACESDAVKNRCFGVLMGGAVGDSLGSYVEFMPPQSREVLERTMTMPGGGPHMIAPGQITDDTELAISLAIGLLFTQKKMNLNAIAESYARWHASNPFDVGTTCTRAFGACRSLLVDPEQPELKGHPQMAEVMRAAALKGSSDAFSNGGLMRCMPLCVWGHKLSPEDIGTAARLDASLSHPSARCSDAEAVYCVAVRHLIEHGGDAEGAFAAAEAYASLFRQSTEVSEWLQDARAQVAVNCVQKEGHVRIAFTLAFQQLLLKSSYQDAIFNAIKGGGDADTNADIVGGMIGALHGCLAIPREYLQKVLECDPSRGRYRPRHYMGVRLVSLGGALYSAAPTHLVVIPQF